MIVAPKMREGRAGAVAARKSHQKRAKRWWVGQEASCRCRLFGPTHARISLTL